MDAYWPGEVSKLPGPVQADMMGWHLANTNQRRKGKGWKGDGIVDSFVVDAALWESWFCTFRDMADLELIYERCG